MRKHLLAVVAIAATVALIGACSTTSEPLDSAGKTSSNKDALVATTCGPNPYNVAFLGEVQTGPAAWQWTWSITNPNPGNGTNGTVQNLSHFNIVYGGGECEMQAGDVVSAQFSFDGQTWNTIDPTPFQDPAYNQTGCPDLATAVAIKFNVSTTGGSPLYYRITVNKNFDPVDDAMTMTWKSGATTGCGCSTFKGMGCDGGVDEEPEGCSWSQGFYFASPVSVWNSVTVGGHTYSYAEGRAIFRTSNKGGITASKKAFLQVASIYLSGGNVSNTASVWADVAICENWLSTLGKITTTNYNVAPYKSNADVSAAAGRIGTWIDTYHCE